MKIPPEEIESNKTEKGGWTKETLAKWGVPWPPPKGWKKSLIEGLPLEKQTFATEAMRARYSDSLEAKLLHRVVMAIIESGHGDILSEIDELNQYYGSELPKVEDFIGDNKKYRLEGGLEVGDEVYRFSCFRKTRTPNV